MPRWMNFVVWPLFGIYLVILFSKDAKLKRWLFPIVLVGFAGTVVALVWVISPFGSKALLLAPILAVQFFLFHRAVRFCDVCGKTVVGGPLLSRPRFCSGCGAPLDKSLRG
jgi:hypothetical protein